MRREYISVDKVERKQWTARSCGQTASQNGGLGHPGFTVRERAWDLVRKESLSIKFWKESLSIKFWKTSMKP